MMGWRHRLSAAFAAAAIAAACAIPGVAQEQKAVPPCGGDEIARGIATRIVDGRTLMLDDGREVRLAAIEVPPISRPGESGAAPGGALAKDALTALAEGEEVLLRRAQASADRYGRLFAYAYTLRDGEEIFAQEELIAAGLARVADRIGDRACAGELLGRENTARQAKLGLWAEPYYDPLQADNPADILAQRGRFALVEGKVVSVRESGATIYVNFGRRWSESFAVTILKRNERSFAAAGLDPKRLEGRHVRVRGWIEGRGGTAASPRIEAVHPEQIEVSDRQ
jgi:endonuclease YncB( thermonuclease family)